MEVRVRFKAVAVAAWLCGGLAGCGPVAGLETQARILTQPSCSDAFFPIYFSGRSPNLSGSASRTILASGLRFRGCQVQEVEVVGLPDYRDPVDPKLELSRLRAQRLAEALVKAGFPSPRFQLSPFGEAGERLPGALVPRKRADVYVRFVR